MFFQKKPIVSPPAPVREPDEPPARAVVPVPPVQAADGHEDLLLDALGGVIGALARYPLELPARAADRTAREMSTWQRHATLGMPLEDGSVGTESVGITDRDWKGLVRAATELQREQQTLVDSLVGELRGALWSCVSAVHESVRIDESAEVSTGLNLSLVKRAVLGTQIATIKDEVLKAVAEIDRTLKERREEQQRQYRTLASSLDSLGRQLEEARKESETDPLTRVGNRKHFDVMVQRSVQLFSLGRTPVCLLMIDLNKLKIINDSYGHNAGDAAITSVATAACTVFQRQSDVICRYGGDEFAVILNGCDMPVAQTLARRLVEQVRTMPLPTDRMEFALGASVGVAQLAAGEDVMQWVARADRAMYQAKRQATTSVMIADAGGNIAPSALQRRLA